MNQGLKTSILIAFFFISFLAFGQQKEIEEMSIEELLNVEITGVSRYKQESDKAPNSVVVVKQRHIEERGYQYLSDVLREVPGFDIVDNAARFGEYITFRGIQGNERFLVLIDGRKINPPTGTLLSIGNSISVKNARQIEIIYGPASAVYGADAFAGIINIISDSPKEKGLEAQFDFGTYNSLDARLSGSYKNDKDFSFYFDVNMFRSNGPDFEEEDDIYKVFNNYPANLDKDIKQPIFDHNILIKTQYKSFNFGYYRKYFDEGNALSHNPLSYVFHPDNKWKTATNLAWFNYRYELGNSGALEIDLSFLNNSLSKESQFYKWKLPGNFSETFSQYMTGVDNSHKGTISYHNNIGEKIKFIGGTDVEFTMSIPPYANDELLGNSYEYTGEYKKQIEEGLSLSESRLAFFGQFTYSPFKILHISAGGRYDYSTRYEGTFNPRLGLVFSPGNSTIAKLIYGTAFQAPSLFYKYEQFGLSTFVMLSESEVRKLTDNKNWKLENQKVESYEISISQDFGKNIRLSTQVYYNKLHDLIERVTFTDSVYNKYFDKKTTGIRNENIGKQQIFGISTTLDAKVRENLMIYGNYSYTHAESEVNAIVTPIPRVAIHKGMVGLTLNNLFRYISVSPRFRWYGKINNLNKAEFPDSLQPGYSSLDLAISSKKILKHFKVNAIVENLLNSKIEYGGLIQQSGIYTATIPQGGLMFKIGISIGF